MDNQSKNKLIVVIALIIIFMSVGFLIFSRSNSSEVSIEGQNIDPSQQAAISNGEALAQTLGSLEKFERLSEDLYVFAKAAYPVNSLPFVGFVAGDEINNNEGVISFRGVYEPIGKEVDISVRILKNDRISVSITDLASELNIDSFLPSNTKRNQFIGTLPASTDTYSVDYDPKDNGFIISIYAYDRTSLDAAYDNAENYIKTGLGVENLNYEKVSVTRSSF